MAPKLFNRFKVKVKTEDVDDDDVPLAQTLGGALGDRTDDESAPLSAFQQERLLREAQGAAGPDVAAMGASSRIAQQRGAPVAPVPASRRTVAGPSVQSQRDEAGGGLASIKLEDLHLAAPRVVHSAAALVPPISTSTSAARSHASSASAGKPEPVDDDDVKNAAPARDRGTAFLHQADCEARTAAASNAAFFVETDEAGSLKARAFDQPQLAWIQMPRMPAAPCYGRAMPAQNARELLDALPAGAVGTLRVHRSGKVTLVFDRVGGSAPSCELDITVTAKGDTGAGDMAQSLVAMVPNPDAETDLRCYDLGAVTQKLVCIPRLDEDN